MFFLCVCSGLSVLFALCCLVNGAVQFGSRLHAVPRSVCMAVRTAFLMPGRSQRFIHRPVMKSPALVSFPPLWSRVVWVPVLCYHDSVCHSFHRSDRPHTPRIPGAGATLGQRLTAGGGAKVTGQTMRNLFCRSPLSRLPCQRFLLSPPPKEL